jgi:arylsulfatase
MMSSIGPSIGADHGSPVSPRYRAPFTFTGTLHEIEIQLVSPRAPGTAEATARAEMSRQ